MCVGVRAEPGASPWQEAPYSRLRLVSATGLFYQGRPVTAAAVEIALDEGWKTYWRTPGGGLPPAFDWKRSRNLDKAEVLWPAPIRFPEADGTLSAGYGGRLVVPLLVTAADGEAPVELRLDVSYAVCKDICVPVEASLQLSIERAPHEAHRDLIRAAMDKVPREQRQGVYCPHSFITAARASVQGKPALVIKTAFDEQSSGLDLFVEAPGGMELPPVQTQPPSSRGRSHYVLLFDSAEALAALSGVSLRLTTVSEQGSCESTWRVK